MSRNGLRRQWPSFAGKLEPAGSQISAICRQPRQAWSIENHHRGRKLGFSVRVLTRAAARSGASRGKLARGNPTFKRSEISTSESEPFMKVGIVGTGAVGSACALALVMRGCARHIVLVDRTRRRAQAVATDIRYGAPLSPLSDIDDGDYQDLAGASLIMITAGVNEKTGGAIDRKDPSGRLKLL